MSNLGDFDDVWRLFDQSCSDSAATTWANPSLGTFDAVFKLIDTDKARLKFEKHLLENESFNRSNEVITKLKSIHINSGRTDFQREKNTKARKTNGGDSETHNVKIHLSPKKKHEARATNPNNGCQPSPPTSSSMAKRRRHRTVSLPNKVTSPIIPSSSSHTSFKPYDSVAVSSSPYSRSSLRHPHNLSVSNPFPHIVPYASYLESLGSLNNIGKFQQFPSSPYSKTTTKCRRRSYSIACNVPRSKSDTELSLNDERTLDLELESNQRKYRRQALLDALSTTLTSSPQPASSQFHPSSHKLGKFHLSTSIESLTSSNGEHSSFGFHIFIDNSNVLHGAQNYIFEVYQTPKHLIELNYPALFRLITNQARQCVCQVPDFASSFAVSDIPIIKKVLVASKPSTQDCVTPARKAGYETHVLERTLIVKNNRASSEPEVVSTKERFVDELLHGKIGESLLDYHNGVLCIVSGDGNWSEYGSGFAVHVARAIKRNWIVVIFSFRKQLSSVYNTFKKFDRFFIFELDGSVWELVSVK